MSRLPILNYHGLESKEGEFAWRDEEKPYVLSSATFEAQMDHIVASGFSTLTPTELGRWLDERNHDQNPMVLTFDDGHFSHYQYVAPCLKRKNLNAIFFVPAALVGEKEQMSWSQLKELVAQGFEIGSHGLRHIPLTNLGDGLLAEELGESKKILEEKLDIEVKSFSVPLGFYEPRIRKVAAQLGYRFLFTSQFDVNDHTAEPLRLKRLVVKKDLTLERFSMMIHGRLGMKKSVEQLKDLARRFMAPSIYEAAAGFKRSLDPRMKYQI